MIWSQNYNPLGSLPLSALIASIPVVVLLGLLAFGHVRAQLAALAGLITAGVLAIAIYHMPPQLALAAAEYGALFGLFPIGWILINALFLYNLSVRTGQFTVLQQQVTRLSQDRRIQALLIAFSFGAFIEGAAGFGTPVAITGALLIGIGFRPLEAAKLALIGNTAPVAFGSLGTPILTLAKVTHLDTHTLGAMVGRQLPVFSLIVPFWLVAMQSGWRGMMGVWPACLVSGLTFAVTQFAVSNCHGPWLVDTLGSVTSMGALVLLLKFWKPAPELEEGMKSDAKPREQHSITTPQNAWKAWIPWACLTLFVFLWGLPSVKSVLHPIGALSLPIPGLHQSVQRIPPAVAIPESESAIFQFNPISSTGTGLLLAGFVSSLALGVGPARMARLYWETLSRLKVSLLTISLMLALGFTTRYSGTDTTLGLALAATGFAFPFFSPLIGWLGVALTGSDTSSNVLFGNLQQVTAHQLNLPPILTTASNSSGGVMGKMIDAQSLVVASVATGGRPDSPDAGTVLKSVFWHSLALAGLMGLLVMLQAYVFPGMVPP